VSSSAIAAPQRELVLDRYRPLRPLGRGGSGSVWLARDERTGLDIALKIVPREGKRAPRAAREAEAAARLRHERCVRAYDFGGDDSHVYIAYEYVPGRTLRDALRHGAVSDREAVEAAAQVLDGLAHAHARGIVHRDVKPSNVLLQEGERVSAKLLDFGLAQFDEADTLTAVGDVPGTLAYIAPERLTGDDATPASDVWAVGVMLWEALAGRHPFWGVPLPQVAATIEAGAPPLTEERPNLPRRLVSTVESALAIDPAKRPRASVLAAELREALTVPEPSRVHAAPIRLRRPKFALPAKPAALEVRALSAGVAGLVTVVSGALLPFWTPGLLALLAVGATLATWRMPRLGLAIALFAPLFPLGNEAKGAAILYGVIAIALLALGWGDPRAGLAFAAGPLLAALGGLALVPLAVQPVRGWLRRAVHAALAVPAAVLVAGLRDEPLPLLGSHVGSLKLAATPHPGTVLDALLTTLRDNPAIATTAIALGIVAGLLPTARSRGRAAIALLCVGEVVLILASAPGLPPTAIVLGAWVLCGVLTLGRAR
jgi:serine/threonine-protein kinase